MANDIIQIEIQLLPLDEHYHYWHEISKEPCCDFHGMIAMFVTEKYQMQYN